MVGSGAVLDVAAPPTVVFDASSVGAMPARSVHPTLNTIRPTPTTPNHDFIVIVIVFLLAVTEYFSPVNASRRTRKRTHVSARLLTRYVREGVRRCPAVKRESGIARKLDQRYGDRSVNQSGFNF